MVLSSELYTKLCLTNTTKTVNDEHFATDRLRGLAKKEVLELQHVPVTLHKVIDCWDAFEAKRNQVFSLTAVSALIR
jgi:hypothetical protein